MYVDHITLQDLIKYQGISCEVKKLFELRLKYKKEEKPLQENIKLILNSIYGKTILSPIESKIKIIDDKDAVRYAIRNYNHIIKFEGLDGSDKTIFKLTKSICRHFNFCPLGVNILSMSKRIMNEVFCTAEDMWLSIFYSDTDSMHLYNSDIPLLAQEYEKRYGRVLIGKNLGQFHSDFAEITKDHQSLAYKSIFCGKKTYVDLLINDIGEVAFHCRCKGVRGDVISITANEMFPEAVQCYYDEDKNLHIPAGTYDKDSEFSVMKLYEVLHDGQEIAFDLCKSSTPSFEEKFNFSIQNKNTFIRKLKF
ncbi:hypothetical protein TVAG_498270 [Trichomonas vaginalis G3]|uniref:DNA-directed DNA polymerase n=1 Tax=Trichomonas vaginalis (strain ATCC PRA-98 / G3) TaxID=412133 RepID=A2FLF7_TRIV3|nr:organellar and viral DNA polymerase type B [Trichomonas vaginalis G3]EAX94273.1 hypothetical protein TVAG_498270 [Trichomonas vaginalis G3]KAI5505023.1 organellar and viral DNA polymerase type B [Trichomonas vaginalis G3]|eukprot:XP_001307203.1 hypothetical protein [Trichomonas vaginalis G3]